MRVNRKSWRLFLGVVLSPSSFRCMLTKCSQSWYGNNSDLTMLKAVTNVEKTCIDW